MSEHNAVLSTALHLPCFNLLADKRVILASASPRRVQILEQFGLKPEVVPSTFEENLRHADYDTAGEYAVATASAKGIEVYERLVAASPEDPPELVISADTVVYHPLDKKILEKPKDLMDNLGMLELYNGATVSVITGVTLVEPQISSPGYSLKSLVVTTTVHFADSSPTLLRSYAESGEGIDRAGGFAIQGLGGLLIKGIEGDWYNVLGFPAQGFFEWLSKLAEEGELCNMDD